MLVLVLGLTVQGLWSRGWFVSQSQEMLRDLCTRKQAAWIIRSGDVFCVGPILFLRSLIPWANTVSPPMITFNLETL